LGTNITLDHSANPFQKNEIAFLSDCTLCPRNCGANRFSAKLGFCKSDTLFRVSSIFAHKGEERVISGEKGICNIFFSHCNLQCIYCQNWDISQNETCIIPDAVPYEELIRKICLVLEETENIIGFVSPSHYIPQMLAIIRGIKKTGRNPVFVYNTNGYDKPETLRLLEGLIDVYLPDFKYMDTDLAYHYSQARDYPQTASVALREMYRQKGSTLIINDRGIAESGIIVRHLVLPGAVNQSIEVLRYIAEEISPNLHISLMSQYYPTALVRNHAELNRPISHKEYRQVKDALCKSGFYRGWTQNLESHLLYRPDFSEDQPFREQ
jgi:putative pyruvate formate lyase activating enzyme